jgi:hypothetical protein
MRFSLLINWITILLLPLRFPAGISQVGEALLRTDPVRLEIGAGQVETLQILLVNAEAVYGIDFQAVFNPAVVQVVDANAAQAGLQMKAGGFPKPDFTVVNTADNINGTLRYVVTQVNPTPPASGSGIVLSIQFRGKIQGRSSKLTFTSAAIADRRGVKLPITTQAADLVVVAPSASTPTSPPTPTNIPALPPTLAATATRGDSQPAATPGERLAGFNPAVQPETVLRFEPPTLVLLTGTQASVVILAENVHDLYGIEFHLAYNPDIAEVVDADPDKQGLQIQPAGWWKDGFVAVNQVDNKTGRIDFAATLLRPAEPVSGNQVVAIIPFAARNAGTSALGIETAILSTRTAESIPCTPRDGEISVTANDQAMDEGAGTRAGGNTTGGLALAGAVILGIISAVIAIVYAMRRKKNKPSEH